jgi:hypothetical protein
MRIPQDGRLIAALCLAVCLCSCSCVDEDDKVLTEEGTVEHVDVAGDCWRIASHDGVNYEPLNLPDEFKKDGLAVRFSAKRRDDMVTTCMVGQVVELLGIRKAS